MSVAEGTVHVTGIVLEVTVPTAKFVTGSGDVTSIV
jgi:hypothetical protein